MPSYFPLPGWHDQRRTRSRLHLRCAHHQLQYVDFYLLFTASNLISILQIIRFIYLEQIGVGFSCLILRHSYHITNNIFPQSSAQTLLWLYVLDGFDSWPESHFFISGYNRIMCPTVLCMAREGRDQQHLGSHIYYCLCYHWHAWAILAADVGLVIDVLTSTVAGIGTSIAVGMIPIFTEAVRFKAIVIIWWVPLSNYVLRNI